MADLASTQPQVLHASWSSMPHPWLRRHSHTCITSGYALQQQALLLNAGAEIGLGFLTVATLAVPPRNFLLPFMTWQMLRMRYWAPDAASYHRQVLPELWLCACAHC